MFFKFYISYRFFGIIVVKYRKHVFGRGILKKEFFRGIGHGVPIFLGYLSVSFGFGILAIRSGLSTFEAVLISMTNLTSAGQVAGVGIIASLGGLAEMALTQFIINLRYALMGISLSQKLDESFTLRHRFLASFGITDEIFAVAISNEKPILPIYMYGIISISFIGWTLGTLLGALAGSLLPVIVTDAMGLLLYGMFIAIIIPPSKKEKGVFLAVALAAAFSVVFRYLLSFVSGGFAIIISAIASSVVCAVLFPIDEKEEKAI